MNKQSQKALDDLEQEVRQHIDAGHQSFVVSIYLMAGGISRYKMVALQEAAQQLLLDLGLDVTGMQHREWEYKVYFEVQVPAPRVPEKVCPICAETVKAAAVACRFCGHEFATENLRDQSEQLPRSTWPLSSDGTLPSATSPGDVAPSATGADISPPPQWAPDPSGRHDFRYWDGATWTDHVSNGGVQSVAPLE